MKKIKTKKCLIIGVILSFFILVILLMAYINIVSKKEKEANNKLVNDIKKHYSEYVITNSKAILYCEDESICGAIDSSVNIIIEKKDIKSVKDKYFKIKDTKYYVYYENVNPENESVINISANYIPLDFNIKTITTSFYKNDLMIININEPLELEVKYMDEMYYYAVYMNNVLGIKKNTNPEVINMKREKGIENIPVLYFENVSKDKITYLKDNGYYGISTDEYNNWVNKYIKLKEKAVLLLAKEEQIVDDIKINKNILNLNNSNTVSIQDNSKDISNYVIKNTTSIDNYKKMLNGEKVVEYVAPISNEQKIPVLNYHFFYDSRIGEACNEGICLEAAKFEEHLKYLKDNGYKTLTMEEFRAWMYKEIELPKKSVLITIDDGAMGTGKHNGNKLIPLLEKYDAKATLFLITGWWDINNYRSPNLDVESHTNDMHTGGKCNNNSVGAQLLCSTKEQVMEDLRKSINIVNSTKSFCYPFYMYNKSTIEFVKEAGFKLAFAGGNYKAGRSNNKYVIPRYPIYKGITMNQFINIVS